MVEYKRGRTHTTDTADWKTWASRCGKFRVAQCKSKFEDRTRYYATRRSAWFGWMMLVHMKTYRTRRAAERAIEKWLKSGSPLTVSERRLSRDSSRSISTHKSRKR